MVVIKPVITGFYVTQQGPNWVVAINTQSPANLSLISSPLAPNRIVRRLMSRGKYVECGFWYEWKQTHCTVQLEIGQTYTHTFYVSPGTPPVGLWFFITDACLNATATWTSPLFYTGDWVGAAPPTPFVGTETMLQSAQLIRPGGHYTWWSQGTWYAVIPSPAAITVYRRDGGVWTRQNAAGEPSPAPLTFEGCDSRLSADGHTIHVAYFIRKSSPATQPACYTTFDTASNTWGAKEIIQYTANTSSWSGRICIEEEASGAPCVLYAFPLTTTGQVYYTHRVGGFWVDHEIVGTIANRALHPQSLALDSVTGNIHCALRHDGNLAQHRSRTPSGAWSAYTILPGTSWNGEYVSATHSGALLRIGRQNPIAQASICSGEPPTTQDNGITPANTYPNTVLSALAPANVIWLFVSKTGTPGAYYYNPQGGGYTGPHPYTSQLAAVSSATLHQGPVGSVIFFSGSPYSARICTFDLPTAP